MWNILSSPRYDETTSKWIVDEKDINGKVSNSYDFPTKKEADIYIKNAIINNDVNKPNAQPPAPATKSTKPATKKKETKLDKEINTSNFLEASLNTLNIGDDSELPMNSGEDDLAKEWELKRQAFKKAWDDKKSQFEARAKSMIGAITDMYFDAKIIKKYDHVVYKKDIESADIVTLLQQVDVAERAIIKIMEMVELGTATSRLFEVLAQMQKLVIDLTESKRKFLQNVEEDFKRLKEDIIVLESTSQTAVVGKEGERTLLSTNNSKLLIREIETFTKETTREIDVYTRIPSKNANLLQDSDNMQYAEEVKAEIVDDPSASVRSEKRGLDSFDDDEEG